METRRPIRDLDVLHLMYLCVMIVFVWHPHMESQL